MKEKVVYQFWIQKIYKIVLGCHVVQMKCLGYDQQLYDEKEKVYVHFVRRNEQRWNHGLHLKVAKKENEGKNF